MAEDYAKRYNCIRWCVDKQISNGFSDLEAIKKHCSTQCIQQFGTEKERTEINAQTAEIVKAEAERKRMNQKNETTETTESGGGIGVLVLILVIAVLFFVGKKLL